MSNAEFFVEKCGNFFSANQIKSTLTHIHTYWQKMYTHREWIQKRAKSGYLIATSPRNNFLFNEAIVSPIYRCEEKKTFGWCINSKNIQKLLTFENILPINKHFDRDGIWNVQKGIEGENEKTFWLKSFRILQNSRKLGIIIERNPFLQ